MICWVPLPSFKVYCSSSNGNGLLHKAVSTSSHFWACAPHLSPPPPQPVPLAWITQCHTYWPLPTPVAARAANTMPDAACCVQGDVTNCKTRGRMAYREQHAIHAVLNRHLNKHDSSLQTAWLTCCVSPLMDVSSQCCLKAQICLENSTS